jgi:hypothetical protein
LKWCESAKGSTEWSVYPNLDLVKPCCSKGSRGQGNGKVNGKHPLDPLANGDG